MSRHTKTSARQSMFNMVNECWNLKAIDVVSPVPEIRWQGVEEGDLPGAQNYWMRVSTQEVTTQQRGHAMPDEPDGSPVVYAAYGFITLQLFAPMKGKDTWAKGELLSTIGKRMFMASETGGSIWFRNPRAIELNNDGTWYRWNVIADYQYDEVKGS